MRPFLGGGRGRGAKNRGRPVGRRGPVNRVGRARLNNRGYRRRGRPMNLNRFLHVIPPASFTRSSVGRDEEELTAKFIYSNSQIEKYEEVTSAWTAGTKTTKNCVTRVYVNKSAMAADMSGTTPAAAASKKIITHVSGIHVQGHSTIVPVIVAGGKKIYNANSTTQRNVKAKVAESKPQIGKYHTAPLYLPGKADMINQKGFKLIKQTITGLGTLEFDYGHVGDFLTSVGTSSLTGTMCSVDFSATIHTVPNPGYAADSENVNRYVSPPDFIFMRSKDPSLVLQGFNESTEETNVLTKAEKEMEIFSLGDNKYLAKTDLVNLLPKPKLNNTFRLPQPIRLSKSNNIIAALTIAACINNPLDRDQEALYFFENLEDLRNNSNVGSVSRAMINLPTGTLMVPRPQVAPYTIEARDEKGNVYKPGARYMVLEIGEQQEEVHPEIESEEEDSDSEISIITESVRSMRVEPAIKKRKERENREKFKI